MARSRGLLRRWIKYENLKSFQIMRGDLRWKGTVDLNNQIIIFKSNDQGLHEWIWIRHFDEVG